MEYRCITSIDALRAYLGDAPVVAFDFETAPFPEWRADSKAALDAHKSDFIGVSFSVAKGTAVYVPVRHLVGTNANEADVLAFLAEFARMPCVKVAHNLAFEAMFLYKHGIVPQPPLYDTIAASQLTLKSKFEFRGLGDSGLKKLVSQLCGADMPHLEEVTGGRFFDEMNPQDMETIRYACADSDYALQLYRVFNGWFDRSLPKHRFIVENIESPTAVYVGMMKYNGVLMDRADMLQKQMAAAARIEDLKSRISAITGGVDIGANASTSAFKKYLYDALKLPVLKTTAKFQEAADDEAMLWLKEYCEAHCPEHAPLFDLVAQYRRWQKLKSTYIDGYLQFINAATGRIHPDLRPLGTQTGRFACHAPNMQNQVAPGADPIGVRNFMIPAEGCKLIEADYSQVELRIAAYLSQDQAMLSAYANGEDIHAVTTSAVFGIPLSEAKDKNNPQYKKRRTVAKSTMFGIMYGIREYGLARNLKVNAGIDHTPDECRSYIRGIKRHYTGLAKWQKDVVTTARNNLYTETAIGRRRYLPELRSNNYGKRGRAERMAINSPVQGLAADVLKAAMGHLIVALRDRPYIRPVMTVHDSLVFEVRADMAEEATGVIRSCMEKPLLPDMTPLIAEVSVGNNYGELE